MDRGLVWSIDGLTACLPWGLVGGCTKNKNGEKKKKKLKKALTSTRGFDILWT
jgi:hypothetical protein